jgi:spore coat protein H
MPKLFVYTLSFLCFLAALSSCEKESPQADGGSDGDNDAKISSDSLHYNKDWTFISHGKADHNYSMVFPQDSVNRIEITMTSAQWKSIRNNMKNLFGYDFGGKNQGGGEFPDEETDYVDVLLTFNGKSWKNVGYRLKGNSSLAQAWGEGNYKLPFRLDFDKFEEDYPAVTNQHFYGFKELSFSPSFKDQSLIREKITPDIFRLAGIPAAQTAFYRVYIDFGSGLKYCGVYTAVELPDDNMIKDQFGEENGNIYKPESNLVSFNMSEFDKKNNETAADDSDVISFIGALNSSLRITNAEQWRKGLEATFNIDHFIKYLVVNNAIVNWDSYGNKAHNYYLYNHSVKKLTWIPWDHNEALSGSPGITGSTSTTTGPSGAPGGGHNPLSLSMNEVTSSWPLLKFVATDEVYFSKYKEYLKWFNEKIFTEPAIHGLIDKYFNMITPYAIGSNGEQTGYTYIINNASYTNTFTALKTHISNRKALISSYVP